MRLGIDVGGTFTDLVLIDDETGEIRYTKTLTTPNDLAQGVLSGLEKILQQANASMQNVEYLVHGTTIGTNALIERKGAKVGLITTAGFRDVLEIARVERPDKGLYDMTVDLPMPMVPRYLRLEAIERISADGEVVQSLDEPSVIQAVNTFQDEGVEAIAVCLLFSFRNPDHERRIRDICQEFLPQIPVTISSDVAPEFREFERTSTTVINAYLLPLTRNYINSLQSQLQENYSHSDLRIMQASGGSMTADVAKSHAVNMVNSGPAGGALATALFGKLAGVDKTIGVDMGGTSFDICLIVDDQPRIKSEGEIEGYPVKVPLMDVEGIGAGGGSIAWIDAGGALNIGPDSAGADPGPACYGRGGKDPTVTDANLVLGRINPEYFLGSNMPLHLKPAQEAIRRVVAEPLKLSIEQAAAGIIRVVNANMVRGISVNSTQKGFDLREFSLLAFGGAGPLHAVEIAQDLRMNQVIIPPYCSVFSAFGAVASDVRHDYVQTVALHQSQVSHEVLANIFSQLESKAVQLLSQENIPRDLVQLNRFADLRYEGQSYELTIPVRESTLFDKGSLVQLIADFHDWHRRIYAYGDPSEAVEFISLRLAAIGKVPSVELRRQPPDQIQKPNPKAIRPVYFPGAGYLESNIYNRENLHSGQEFDGPCLIEEKTSTTVIPQNWTGKVDEYQNLVVTSSDAGTLSVEPSSDPIENQIPEV